MQHVLCTSVEVEQSPQTNPIVARIDRKSDHDKEIKQCRRGSGIAAARRWLAFDVSYNELCGAIPQGRYTHRFGPKHFAPNKCLCGRPLAPCN